MDIHPIQITSHNPLMQEKDVCKQENSLYFIWYPFQFTIH